MNSGVEIAASLRVSDDARRILVSASLSSSNLPEVTSRLKRQLSDLNPSESARRVDVDAFLSRELGKGIDQLNDAVLFESQSPTAPTDGRMEWTRDFFRPGFEVDEATGAIDFRKKCAQQSVAEGELLATLEAPVDGTPGLDVYGRPIEPQTGRPLRVRTGKNVTLREGNRYYSERAGRVHWQMNTIWVDEVYVVPGNVGLGTGHIKHDGDLVVHGDILPGSEVTVERDIVVDGVVEGANIRAGGSVTVCGGLIGSRSSSVEAGRDIEAAYILDASVTAGRDIVVEKEIVNSNIEAEGDVDIPSGRIIGGNSHAGSGIRAAVLGSDGGTKTRVSVGPERAVANAFRSIKSNLELLQKDRAKIRKVVDDLEPRAAKLPPERRDALLKLQTQLDNMAAQANQYHHDLAQLLAEHVDPDNLLFAVAVCIHADTTVELAGESNTLKSDVQGPVTGRAEPGTIRLFRRSG